MSDSTGNQPGSVPTGAAAPPAEPGGADLKTPGEAGAPSTQSATVSAPRGGSAQATPPWSATLSNLVIDTVATVRSKATVKVVTGLRLVVYGVVILAALVTAGLLFLVGLVRIWDAYVPLAPVGRRVWLGYVVFGGVMFLAGGWLLAGSRKSRAGSRKDK